MSRWITYNTLYYQSQISKGTYQFNQLLPTIRDEMLEGIGAIAELKLDEIIST